MKDCEIVALYWERNESAIIESEKQYGGYCHSIANNILHNREDADECVNDTWMGAWKSMPPSKPERLATFLGKITRNLSINRLKQYRAEKRGTGQAELVFSELEDCIASQDNEGEVVDEVVLVEAINVFLRGQDQEKRDIFVKRYWYFSSIREISEIYGMSESKITSLLFRMRKELRALLEKEGIYL